jgi:hypothetical protein
MKVRGFFVLAHQACLLQKKTRTSRASKDLILSSPPLSSERSEGNPFAAQKKVQYISAGLFCFGESSLLVREKNAYEQSE